ncbi:MMPL family transporter [Kineosporia babensis]|uniref:MMPL family transporter n=1 Tax=Kineosporia babensis TaxID=499548 RepID=A0A9X1ND44_9ACTN|nr:MMPL family transporter [Kineosporia babensis]MCD5311061.1 MMPL family transporter [Kineosporia babensis]
MAELLYRVGRFAARRHWTVISGWIAAVLVGGLTFVLFAGTITSAITIPDIPTNKVTEQLAAEFENSSGGSGGIVFETTDGQAFTEAQQGEISELLKSLGQIEDVEGAIDPFATQAQLQQSATQLSEGREQLDQGQAQIEDAQTELEKAQEELDQQRQAAEESGALAQAQEQLDAAQEEIDAGAKELQTQSEQLEQQSAALGLGSQVAQLSSGFRLISEDGSAAVTTVSFALPVAEVPAESKTAIEDLVEENPIDGVNVLISQDISQTVPSVLGVGEIVGLLVAAAVLVIMLGTLIGAVLPLASAGLGVGVATLAAMSFSSLVEFMSVTPVLGIMLGLAVGIDYSLFILNRHRKQLKQGVDLHESIGLANGTSGNAVVFAGFTVAIALLALNVTGIPFLGLMGTVGAAAVLVAVLVATTFTPALLSLVGMRILQAKERAALENTEDTAAPATSRPAEKPMTTRAAVLSLVAGIAVLVVIALPALNMRLGLPDGAGQPEDSQAYQAYQVQSEKFGDGVNGPLLVLAELPAPVTEATTLAEQAAVGQAIYDVGDVAAVVPIGVSKDGSALSFQVVPNGGPNSESTAELVKDLRDLTPQTAGGGTADLGVAGNASANIDVSQKLSDVLPVYLVIVVGLSLVILILVFRSILVPLTATLGFVLSLLAAFGGLTAIFQEGWMAGLFGIHEPSPILSFLPIIVTGILFGLAMDYQLFLVSGMREAFAHGAPARLAVRRGLLAGRSVVTAAAIIMISVFGGFIFSHDTVIKPIGFALAFGVLVDAFVVRMFLIPAAMHLLGDKAWWIPKWLDRILPDIDVEGAKLERSHPLHPVEEVVEAEAAAPKSS